MTARSLDHVPLDLTLSDGSGYRGLTLGTLRARGVPAADLLAAVKSHLKAGIDARAEALRLSLVTPGVGQSMEYQEAQAQAVAALKAPSAATPAKYPMLAASIGLDVDPDSGAPATDVLGVARAVQAAYLGWLQAGAAIRRIRLGAKAAIEAAGTIEAAITAHDGADWPAL